MDVVERRVAKPPARSGQRGAAQAVAERRELETTQRQEKETLQAIFDTIPVMISVYDGAGRLLRVNREWERTRGWTLEEARRLDVLGEIYPDPDERASVLQFMQRAERHWADFRPRTREGRVIDMSWVRCALSDGSRIGFGIDITDRKRAEAALRESEARFRQVAENINEVFWLANLDNTEMLYVSPAYEHVPPSCERVPGAELVARGRASGRSGTRSPRLLRAATGARWRRRTG